MRRSIWALSVLAIAACSSQKPATDPSTVSESSDVKAENTTANAASTASLDETAAATSDDTLPTKAASGNSAPAATKSSAASAANATATPAADSHDTAPAPDNTGVNKRDRKDSTLTPMDQGGGQSDIKITQLIRKAVMGDKSLSFTAKNVKIITIGGKVTLRGPVNSDHERSAIEQAAKKVAGVANVDDQLEIKP